MFLNKETKNVSASNDSCARKWENSQGNMLLQECFCNNVSSFAGAFTAFHT